MCIVQNVIEIKTCTNFNCKVLREVYFNMIIVLFSNQNICITLAIEKNVDQLFKPTTKSYPVHERLKNYKQLFLYGTM